MSAPTNTMPASYLQYDKRRYGMDHERYAWSQLHTRPKVVWPNGARVALWVIPALEWFPLDMKGKPFKPPGAMVTSYPDLRHYTLRDYGNRVGIFRIMKALEARGIKASVATNAAVAVRYPALIKACVDQGWEILANGLDMDHLHYEGLAVEEEQRLVTTSLDILRRVSCQTVRGWLSPAKSESFATPDLVAAAGCDYLCDWVNDDMPYAFSTQSGTVTAMPHPCDIGPPALARNGQIGGVRRVPSDSFSSAQSGFGLIKPPPCRSPRKIRSFVGIPL